MAAQLPLGLRLPDTARLDNFIPGPNAEALAAVRHCATTPGAAMLYLAGPAGSGRTHLLQAACRAVQSAGLQAAYVPLADRAVLSPALLEGLEDYALVALDDIDAVAGDTAWEEALFHLYNRLREAGGRLLAAAPAPPEQAGLRLPDLRSRLAWGALYALQLPDDATRLRILTQRARDRGLELSEDVGRFLLHRCPRDLPALLALLDRLDRAALAAQRRLTIPFVREVLGGGVRSEE